MRNVVLYLVIGIVITTVAKIFDKEFEDDLFMSAASTILWPLTGCFYSIKLLGVLPIVLARVLKTVFFGIGFGITCLLAKLEERGSE